MLKVKLYELLKHHNISTYSFAKAIKATGIRSENWAYRLVRGELNLTMDTLELVISVISQISNTKITVTDILTYQHSNTSSVNTNNSVGFVEQTVISTPLTIVPEGEIKREKLKFIVNPIEGVLNYTFSIFHYKSKSILIFENTPNNIFIPSVNILCPNVEYGWKVKAFSLSGWSSFSTTKRFIISSDSKVLSSKFSAPPNAPQAVSPSGLVSNLKPALIVNPVDNATGYSFYLRDIHSDAVYDFEYATKCPEFQVPENILKHKGKYKWNSRAFNCGGFSATYSNSLIFEINLKS